MKNQLLAAATMIAVTALTPIRYNGERHVPGSPSADFEADEKTAHSLVKSGAAKYTDPDQVAPDDTKDTGTGTETSSGTGSAGAGSEGSVAEGGSGGNLEVKVEVADPAVTKAAQAAQAAAAATTPATTAKPAAKSAPAKKVAAKKAPAKKAAAKK